MTEHEIERCLERFATSKATDVMNFDYAGTLAYIQRLKAKNDDLRERLDKFPIVNIGDTIWYIFGLENGEIQPWDIERIEILKGEYILRLGHNGTDDYNAVSSKYLGEVWFLTKGAAELELAKLKGEKK